MAKEFVLWLAVTLFVSANGRSIIEQEFEEEVVDNGWDPAGPKYHSSKHGMAIETDDDWMDAVQDIRDLGAIGGVSTSPKDPSKLFVFHRGDRQWSYDTFNKFNMFDRNLGPIVTDTILVLDTVTGEVLSSFGRNMFYMPHGLTVDGEGNIWVTDVGLHQVFKLQIIEEDGSPSLKVVLTLGEEFIPGNDDKHFCKPTDVAVMSNGSFFVADGYCNGRVLMFSPDGTLENVLYTELETKDSLEVPHSLALNERLGELCVADRENERVVCFNTTSGLVDLIMDTDVPPYAIAYGKRDYHVVGYNPQEMSDTRTGFTVTDESSELIGEWDDEVPDAPHAITASADGKTLFIGSIGMKPTLTKLNILNEQ